MDLKRVIADELGAVRRRSLDLLAPLGDDDLLRQHSPLMSPLAWDLAHVGNYEDLWLLRAIGADGVRPDLDGIYDAFRHPLLPSLPALHIPAAALLLVLWLVAPVVQAGRSAWRGGNGSAPPARHGG